MKNVMNKNLEEDLNYEQELNRKMQGDIEQFEADKVRIA